MKSIVTGIVVFLLIAFLYEDAIELAGKLLGIYVIYMLVKMIFFPSDNGKG